MSDFMEIKDKPTYIRQRYLLAFLNKLNEPLEMTYIQKLIFLNEKASGTVYYDFVPYKYGPYSFQLADDLNLLSQRGFIVRKNGRFCAIVEMDFDDIQPIAPERGNILLKKAYRDFPYYAINSVILERLFDKEEAKLFKRCRIIDDTKTSKIFTIGYEGKSLEAFINILIHNNVSALCDVRKNPISRKYGFSQKSLAHILPQVGIMYYSFPELGIDSEKRTDLDTIDDYKRLFSDYQSTLPNREVFLNNVYKLYEQHHRIALMCYEKEPEMCHRHVIRDYMLNNYSDVFSEDL